MKKRVAVIGSNSFSGSDFIDVLLENPEYEVIGISRSKEKSALFLPYKRHKNPQFRFYQLDLNTQMKDIVSLLGDFRPSYMVNFAALSEVFPSWEHPEQWYQTNVVSLVTLTKHLIDASYLQRYVHISTPEVYGSCKTAVLEGAEMHPTTPYAASKAAFDLHLFALIRRFHFPAVLIRSTNVYGARQQLYKVIPRSIISIKQDKKIPLHMGGEIIRSYIHIRDISRGELLAMEKGKNGELYHLSPDNTGMKIKDVVRLISRLMHVPFRSVTRTMEDRVGQDFAYRINSAKARKTLGWKPRISLEDGITDVIKWIETNWGVIRRMPHEYVHKP